MKKEPIDFQEFDVSVEDGVEAGVKRVHGRSILNKTKPNTVVYFDTVEDFDEEPDEPSVFDAIIDRVYSLKSEKEAREFIETAVLRMVMVLKMPRTKTSETLCKAFLVDSFDLRIDLNPPDENDHWRWSKRFPRLSKLANVNHGAFEIFRKVMAITNLPDLTKPQKTAKETEEEKAAEIAYLKKQVRMRKKAA